MAPRQPQILEAILLPDVREMIQEGDLDPLTEVVNRWLPADIAPILEDLEPDERLTLFRLLEPPLRSETFAYLAGDTQEQLLESLTNVEVGEIFNPMAPDDRTGVLEELPSELKNRIIALLTPAEREVAESLLDYEPETVGRLMTPDFVAVKRDWTIRRVLDHIRAHGRDSETLNHIYVTDDQGRLIDDFPIRQVLLTSPDNQVSNIMDGTYLALTVNDPRREAVDVFRKYDRTALPVINGDGVLVGIVTVDDVIDVAEEEATREIQRFGGLEALEDPYMETPLLEMVRKRAVWLVVLFVGEMFTASAMAYFQDEIAAAVVLALFIPLIVSSGGNSGSQAATLLIRALAVRDVTLRDWWKVMWREILSGLMLGCILGAVGFMRIWAWQGLFHLYGEHWYLIGATVSISLIGVVLYGTLSGAMLPFLLKSLGLDPATSSAPFVATLVDVMGLIIYFSVAMAILRGTLL